MSDFTAPIPAWAFEVRTRDGSPLGKKPGAMALLLSLLAKTDTESKRRRNNDVGHYFVRGKWVDRDILAEKFGVSASTIWRWFRVLETDGLVREGEKEGESGIWIADLGRLGRLADCKSETADCKSETADCKSETADCKSETAYKEDLIGPDQPDRDLAAGGPVRADHQNMRRTHESPTSLVTREYRRAVEGVGNGRWYLELSKPLWCQMLGEAIGTYRLTPDHVGRILARHDAQMEDLTLTQRGECERDRGPLPSRFHVFGYKGKAWLTETLAAIDDAKPRATSTLDHEYSRIRNRPKLDMNACARIEEPSV